MGKTNEHPILFSGTMVRAIMECRKTQTRRVCLKAATDMRKQGRGIEWAGAVHPAAIDGWVAWWPGGTAEFTKKAYDYGFSCPYGKPGDLLWVRETWAMRSDTEPGSEKAKHYLLYRAHSLPETFLENCWHDYGKWRPSIHMPRWASRLTLRVTDVGVQRVQEISHTDAIAEGCPGCDWVTTSPYIADPHTDAGELPAEEFQRLWDTINGKRGYPWESDPWVWAVTFERVEDSTP